MDDRISNIKSENRPFRRVILKNTADIDVEEFCFPEGHAGKKGLTGRHVLYPRRNGKAVEMDKSWTNLSKYSEPFPPPPDLWAEQHLEFVSASMRGLVYQRSPRYAILLEEPICFGL